MNTRISTQTTCNVFCKAPFYRYKFRSLLLLVAGLLAIAMFSINLAQAANILQNPGFEADGNHGSGTAIGGWNAPNGGPWYINSDFEARSGNNYYKVWGAFSGSANYQAVFQDNSSLPTSTYQADAWLKTSTNNAQGNSDIMWSGDDADYAWVEVSFRDASDNILALYKSDIFSDTLGSVPYMAGPWIDFPVTNICSTNPPYSVIGSTNLLVAPPGTVKVRFQHTLYQLLYGGGSCYMDDTTLNQISGPVPPQITQVYPGNLLFASNYISFHVTSASSSPISYSNIHLYVGGTDVSSGCTFSGSTPDISVLYTNLTTNVWAYTASITVTDAYNFTANNTMNFDTLMPTFVWEAEDYDFTNSVSGGGGSFYDSPILSSTPVAGSYYGTIGDLGVDFSGNGNNAAAPNLYRTNDHSGIGFAAETARQKFITAEITDPGVYDYTVGYIRIGDWMNYTHHYPAGTYNIYARLAGGAGATVVALSNVISGTLLGNFQFNGTDWGAYHYVPLVDTNDNLLPFTFDGSQQTLSVSLVSGGDNMNFFMLMPAVVGQPTLSNITPTNGTIFSTASAFSFSVASPTTINNSGIHLSLNGSDVSSLLSITGTSTSKNVSFAPLVPNTIYTAVIAVTNAIGEGVSRMVTFDTMSTANFYVKICDFDYNGGAYDTNGNGLSPNAYIGDGLPNDIGAGGPGPGPILSSDYFHATNGGGAFPYRGPNSLATEVTADIPLPGFFTGFDYDVGYFNTGDFGNYTRNYPAGEYLVYGRLAGGNGNLTAYLDQVTGGLGTTTQTTQRLGTWRANTGGWQNWAWVPLTDAGLVSPVIVTLGGVSTLRVTSGGNINANYFMLVSATGFHISAALSGGNVNISFPTQAGASYRVFYNSTLTGGTWSLLATVPGNGSVQTVSDPNTSGQRFYRVTSP